jgi:hypothetical protein
VLLLQLLLLVLNRLRSTLPWLCLSGCQARIGWRCRLPLHLLPLRLLPLYLLLLAAPPLAVGCHVVLQGCKGGGQRLASQYQALHAASSWDNKVGSGLRSQGSQQGQGLEEVGCNVGDQTSRACSNMQQDTRTLPAQHPTG